MTETQTKFIKQVRDLAQENYEQGGDQIIECFSDQDIIEHFDNLEQVKQHMEIYYEHQKEIEATIW